MTLYLETSVLFAALTAEADTGRVQAWLTAQDADDLAISDWLATEFSSALSTKLRTGQIETRHRARALAAFAQLCAESFAVLPVSGGQFRTAARFADQHVLGLRAGDALHLAICAEHGATLCTLDQHLADAGPAVGVPTLLV